MTLWTVWREVPASVRAEREQALEPLADQGFVVTSREVSRDGPWRIQIYGQGDRTEVQAATGPDWHWQELPDRNWVAENQRSFQPFVVGPFWIHPSHVSEGQPPGTIALRIDAGLAFGTGTHATTRGCLEVLATLDARETANAADIGCGSGILAIAMAKLWKRPVIGGDNDAEAVAVARENAALNGAGELCSFVHAEGLGHDALEEQCPYDLIVANILAGPLIALGGTLSAAVRSGGYTLLSGLLVEQAAEILTVYDGSGFTPERHVDLETGGAWWRTLLLRRR